MAPVTSPKPSAAPLSRWRCYKVWLNIHLYTGLSVGLVFVLAGLTGSLLVFYVELDEILNPQLQISAGQTLDAPKPLEEIYQALRKAHPDRTGAWRLEMPRHKQAPMMARYYQAKEKQHMHFAPMMAWVNPYTAEVISTRFWGFISTRFWGDFMTWIYDLHYALLLDSTGMIVMGIIGILLLMVVLVGVYLWWPKTGRYKTALTFKRNASTERFVYDLHKINGSYSLLVIVLLLVSGVVLELPDYINPIIDKASPLAKEPSPQSAESNGKARISLDQAVAIANEQFPEAEVRWLETPKDANGIYRFRLYQAGEASQRFPKTTLWLDQYSGAVLASRNPRHEGVGDTFLNWMHPLHNGEIIGMTGRIIVFISGFVPLALYVTGYLRWRQKRMAKIKSKSSNR